MKMKNVLVVLLLLFIISCNQSDIDYDVNCVSFSDGEVLKDRTANKKWSSYEESGYSNKNQVRNSDILHLGDVVGYTYNFNEENDPFVNVGIPAINMDKFKKENPGYYSERSIPSQSSNYFSFTSFDKYEHHYKDTKIVNAGFSLNLGLFSIGAKRKHTKVFSEQSVNENNRVFGQYYIQVTDSLYRIAITEDVINIMSQYITPQLQRQLYMNTPEQAFHGIGSFVVAGFHAGGMSEAVYMGDYKSNYSLEEVKKEMNSSIEASYGRDVKVQNRGDALRVSGEFGYGKDYSNKEIAKEAISEIKISVRTLGGDPTTSAFSSEKEIEDINVNLNGWLTSLSDRKLHTIVKFTESGLLPITEFILEKNIKEAFLDLMSSGGADAPKRIQEPLFAIQIIPINGDPSRECILQSSILTRSGHQFIISQKSYVDFEQAQFYSQREVVRLSDILPIKIRVLDSNHIPPLQYRLLNFDLIDYENCYQDDESGISYLYSEKTKTAITIYNNRVIEDYGLEGHFDSLIVKQEPPVRFFRDYTFYAF